MADRSYTDWTPESQAAVDAALGRATPVADHRIANLQRGSTPVEITGETLAGCYVIGISDDRGWWRVRGQCGHEFLAQGFRLRRRDKQGKGIMQCPKCAKGEAPLNVDDDPEKKRACRACTKDLPLHAFDRNHSARDGYRYDCRLCVSNGLGKTPRRDSRKIGPMPNQPRQGINCTVCLDLSHRRKRPRCLKCDRPYRAEDEMRVDVEAKREGATVWPEW